MARYTCADCGEPTDNYSLICDVCAPEYADDAGKTAATSFHQIFDPPANRARDAYGESSDNAEDVHEDEHLSQQNLAEETGHSVQTRKLPVRDDQGRARA